MEDSNFVKLFGKRPIVLVLDFLIENDIFDYSKTDICKHTGVGWSTLHLFWDKLEDLSIVKKTRSIGRAELFQLNKENPVVAALLKFDLELSFALAKVEAPMELVAKSL